MLKKVLDLDEALNLWNEEVGFIYPLSKALFHQNTTLYKNCDVTGFYEENRLVGFIITKLPFDDFIKTYNNMGWISLMYVSRKHRNKGVGDALIKDAFEKLKSAEKIRIGGDLFNFFPGVPSDFLDVAVPFFTKHGFIKTGDCYDMVNLNLTKFSYKGLKPEMRYLKSDELQLLQTFIKDAFPGRWEFEVNDYVIKNGSGKEFLCAFVDEKIVGYVRVNREDNVDLPYNTNWCARFGKCAGLGPLGVHKDYRKHGIGYNLLVEAFNTLKDFGYDKVVIDWTGLVGFYQRFGFEIFKRFVYFTKERRIK